MEIQSFHSDLRNTSEHYEVKLEINGKIVFMDVYIQNGKLDHYEESYKSRIWRTLILEEKYAIEDKLQEYFTNL